MSEIEELKKRIKDAGYAGLETAIIREDYEPVGQMMIRQLTESGQFISQRSPGSYGIWDGPWKVWSTEFSPR
jgi:hypothetical protein